MYAMTTCTWTIARFLAFLLVIGSYQWQVSTLPVLTPSTVLSVCPGDEVVINCCESENTTDTRVSLRWQITLMDNSVPTIELPLNDHGNNTNRQEGGLEFYAELTSYSPLRAILTTTAHSALDGATVRCYSASSGPTASEPLIIRITQILDQPEIQWLNVNGRWFEADSLTVIIEWEGNNDCLKFTISLTSPADTSSDYNITTKNRSYTFNILYNTNYTVTVASSSGTNSVEMSKNIIMFNFIKCEPLSHQDISGYIPPALEDTQISVSCLTPNPDLECKPRECIQLSSGTDVYTTTNGNQSTALGSFECVHTNSIISSTNPDPNSTPIAVTDKNGYLMRVTVALGVGIPLILVCLCLVGTAAAVLSSLVVKRKRESYKQENKQSAEDSQNRENHTIEHWGIYSLLAQPDQPGSARNSTVYAEIGSKAIIPPEGKKGACIVMPDTNVQYAEVKKKLQSNAEQQEHCATSLDMSVVLHLDQLLLKLRSQVSPKWRQFGFAVRVPVETLNDLSSYQDSEEQRLSEIAGYWMKQHQGRLTWREVARIMKEIDLNDLAEEILNDSKGDAVENETTQHYHTVAELSSTDLSDDPAKTDTDDSAIIECLSRNSRYTAS